MPYKDKLKDRLWHKQHMRMKRKLLKYVPKSEDVTPSTLKPVTPIDADGNAIYDE
uniref:Uncharacterized protein n=1 Tax=viral metagenome TaxID=1070528 RepID=A0A6M3KGG3_9ZZZZ